MSELMKDISELKKNTYEMLKNTSKSDWNKRDLCSFAKKFKPS
jgi:hypothetical protein